MANGSTGVTPVIHYKTGFLTCPQNTAIIVTGIIAVTALVIGILSLLHAKQIFDMGLLGSIPPAGINGLIYGGGGLLLIDVMALVILSYKHTSVKKEMEQERLPVFSDQMPPNQYIRPSLSNVICQTDELQRKTITVYRTPEEAQEHQKRLSADKALTHFPELRNATGAFIEYHDKETHLLRDAKKFVKAIWQPGPWNHRFSHLPQARNTFSIHTVDSFGNFDAEVRSISRFYCILSSNERGYRAIHLFSKESERDDYARELLNILEPKYTQYTPEATV